MSRRRRAGALPALAATSALLAAGVHAADAPLPAPTGEGGDAERAAAEAPDADAPTRVLDRIEVTGTRIARIEMEGALPVSTVERAELERTGAASVSDALRDLPWNSAGSLADIPNSDVPNLSLPRLRGLGSKYTLTLLDGARLPGAGAIDGGAAASVTGIPLAALDRVEVLREGASAVYGSDAIGGVINLVTRRGEVPPTASLQWEAPSGPGGDAWRGSAVAGWRWDGAELLLAAEFQRRDMLLGADRDVLRDNAPLAFTGNPGAFRRIDPASGDFVGFFEADPRCPDALDSDPTFPSSVRTPLGPGQACGYRFRDLNAERAAWRAASLFANGSLALGDAWQGFGRLLLIDGDSRTQSAPSPFAGIRVAADAPFNPTRGEVAPDLGYPLLLLYRLTALGPRRSATDDTTLHLLLGAERPVGLGLGGELTVSAYRNRQDSEARQLSGFALRSAVQDAVTAGRFDPFGAGPGDDAGLRDALHFGFSRHHSRALGVEASLAFDAPWLDDTVASYALGVGARRDRFATDADEALLANQVVGQGTVARESAQRSWAALYGEAFWPLGPRWEATLAARLDRYEDVGSAFSPRLSLAFRPGAAWLLRASAGRGFQAPDLVSAYGGFASYDAFLVDPIECAANPDDPVACSPRPLVVDLVPNPALGPERARHAGLGVVWQPRPSVDLSLDYTRTRIDDEIGTLPEDAVLAAELACSRGERSCDPVLDGQVLRDAFGNLERIVLPRINIAGTRVSALDAALGWRGENALGAWRASLQASRVLSFERQLRSFSPVESLAGGEGRPRWRGQLVLDWERGRHGATVAVDHIAAQGDCTPYRLGDGSRNPDCAQRIGSHTEVDLQWRWQTPWGTRLAIGARNLRDRPPPLQADGSFSYGLYDPIGRVLYLQLQQAL